MPVSTASMPCHLQIGFGARIKIHLPAYGIHVNYNAAALCSGDHILQQTMNAEAAAAAVEVACYSQTTPEAFDFALIPVLQDPNHGICFHIGEGPDGSPLLSWSTLYAIYELPDGSKWAEHSYLHDDDDITAFGIKAGKDVAALLPKEPQELIMRQGRYHSLLQNVDDERWIHEGCLPDRLSCGDPENAFFWTRVFDPHTLQEV
eukprot:jgi/Chrzof1/1849/Cz10g23180.t1